MLRIVEITLPRDQAQAAPDVVRDHEDIDPLGVWQEDLSEGLDLVRALVPQEDVEPLIDAVDNRWGSFEETRIVVLAVETSLPREEDEEEAETATPEVEESDEPFFPRISRDELYDSVTSMAQLDGRFVSFVLLATVVASIGLLQDNVAVIIGSMVIAPLLGPVVCLSLATVLADLDLTRQALLSNAVGVGIAVAASVLIGLALPVDPGVEQIATRTQVSLWDVSLGLAVGAAGSLSFTTGLSTALVGVMVAVALLPPLVTFGLLVGDGHVVLGTLAGLQALIYLISINLSGVVIFALQGIRPANWWEEGKARRATITAVAAWTVLLALLGALVRYATGG